MQNSTKPAVSSAESCAGDASLKLDAISAEIVDVPDSSTYGLISKACEMTSTTEMVSPSARPRASMLPPMMPLLPNGSTTVRTIAQRVAPRASAASFSPTGASEKTSRITEVAIGKIIIVTAIAATNAEPAYDG